jgi:hypothetical protein
VLQLEVPRLCPVDAGKGVVHDADQGAIAEADKGRGVDALNQDAGLVGGEHGGLAALDDVLGAAHRRGRIGRRDLADAEWVFPSVSI